MSIQFKYPAMNSAADVEKVIAKAIESAKTMKQRVQYAAIGCMILAGKEGKDEDGVEWGVKAITQANYLVNELGAGVRADGLVKFMVYMCGFEINDADKKSGFTKIKSIEWIKANFEAAKEKAWFDYAPAPTFKGFDLHAELTSVLAKADRAIAQSDGDEEKAAKVEIDRDMLEVIGALLTGKPVTADNALKLVSRITPEPLEEAA